MTDLASVEISTDLIDAYRAASREATRMEGVAKALRRLIEQAMGEAEYATVDGEPAIRWAHVKSRRLDAEKLRQNVDPAVLASCYVEAVQRRFIPLGGKTEAQP